MLRRKLLARLGVLVLCFVCGAVISIALLQAHLADLDKVSADATALTNDVQELGDLFAALNVDSADRASIVSEMREVHARLGEQHAMHLGQPGEQPYARVGELLAELDGPEGVDSQTVAELGAGIVDLRKAARAFIAAEQRQISHELRKLIIGLTVAALIMVNLTVIMLLRTASMILRPVAALVEGSRQLAAERFDHRVEVDQDDEFGELAHAYNALAEQLQANEQRKVETLRQLAVSLNHELNNMISVIELQLRFLDRKAGADQSQAGHLRQIRENLSRIAETVASLKDVRRIVVTDYIPGLKMLDLPRCTGAGGESGEQQEHVQAESAPPSVQS